MRGRPGSGARGAAPGLGGPIRQAARFVLESWIPLAAWLLATVIVLAAASYVDRDPVRASVWAHSDSQLYVDQAVQGPKLQYCPGSSRTEWCGNAGWFPGYPWAIRLVHAVGAPYADAALALAWAFGAATLVLLWRTFLRRQVSFASLTTLAYAAVSPGIAFRYGIYPLSMLTFFTLASLWLLARRRIVAGGLAGAAAVCSYPAGLALIPAAGLWLMVCRTGASVRSRLVQAAIACGLISLGLGAVLVADWVGVGKPNAYFLVQAKYGHGFREPFAPLHNALYIARHGSEFALRNIPYLETLIVFSILLCLFAALAAGWGKKSPESILIGMWAFATWVLTSVPAGLSHYREDAVLLPIAPLVRLLPGWLIGMLAAVAACLAVPMTVLYVRGQLP